MNHFAKASLALVCVVLLAACGQSGNGPGTWLDRPLHGMQFELGPIILHAHASDADGVAAILFYVDNDLVAVMDVSTGQFGEAIYQWDPPAPGTYTIHAVGVDANSNRGSSSSVVITIYSTWEIGSPEPGPATQAVDTPRPSDTPIHHTPGPQPPGPTDTPTPTPSKTPTPTNTPTATSTPDLEGPTILLEAFDPEPMVGGSPSGCDGLRYGTHSLLLNDPADIWYVWANWFAGSQSGTVYYTTTNGYLWTGVYGPFNDNGITLYLIGRAIDNYDNGTPFGDSILITNCIG